MVRVFSRGVNTCRPHFLPVSLCYAIFNPRSGHIFFILYNIISVVYDGLWEALGKGGWFCDSGILRIQEAFLYAWFIYDLLIYIFICLVLNRFSQT